MKSLILAAGVAALAITAPAMAERGGGGGNKGGQSAKAERGGGGGGQKAMRAERGGGGGQKAMRAERGGNRNEARVQQRAERRLEARGRSEQRVEMKADRVDRKAERKAQRVILGRERDHVVQREAGLRDFDENRWTRIFGDRGLPRSFVGGCPPGLAKKTPACVPPGQVKNLVGQALPGVYASQMLPLGLRDLYRDTDDYYYRFGDGYLYQVDRDRNLIMNVLPLIGAGLGIGMPFPYNSPAYNVPSYYQSFYPNVGDDYYRYANGYVYEIDGRTGLIEDMIPLLDNGYGVGQMLPASYSYYNLPMQYRSYYPDNDDYYYRYAPGAIYQVDRDTQLITSIVSLLTGNRSAMAIGQPLPVGYDAYNVPYAYRSQYYDTPDQWYRYSNGQIYQVDPTTRLITAIVDAIV